MLSKLESAISNNDEDDDHGEIRKIEAKHFAINQQFILGCHEDALGPGDADIVYSAMNLPLAVGFWSTQDDFTAVEEKVGEAEVATTVLAMVSEQGDWAEKNDLVYE